MDDDLHFFNADTSTTDPTRTTVTGTPAAGAVNGIGFLVMLFSCVSACVCRCNCSICQLCTKF